MVLTYHTLNGGAMQSGGAAVCWMGRCLVETNKKRGNETVTLVLQNALKDATQLNETIPTRNIV